MIRLSGRVPGKDIRIEYTGLRPGERLREELFHKDEHLEKTGHQKILLARHRSAEWQALAPRLQEVRDACNRFDEARISDLIRQLVPELSSDNAKISNVISLQKGAS